jgi:hypothetical protein
LFDYCFVLLVERSPKRRRTKTFLIVEQRIVEHPNVSHPIQMQLQFREDNICLTRKEQVWPKINLYNTDYTVGAA